MAPKRHSGQRPPAAGDIVVMKVANHYHVCLQQADDRLAPIKTVNHLDDAIALACQIASGSQRVFLYSRSGSANYLEIDCAKPH